jgi:hypothetical protein
VTVLSLRFVTHMPGLMRGPPSEFPVDLKRFVVSIPGMTRDTDDKTPSR